MSGEMLVRRNSGLEWQFARWLLAGLVVLFACLSLVATAAEMQVVLVKTPDGTARYVSVDRDIVVGDWLRFVKLLRQHPDVGGVLLSSNGGSLDDGLAIAKHIYDRGLGSMVTGRCHSVCSIIFLAGHDRYITPTAELSVHSAYKQIGDWVVEDEAANATVAWFLGHMGYPLPLARLWLSTASDDMAPITLEMNDKLKLGFRVIDGATRVVAAQ